MRPSANPSHSTLRPPATPALLSLPPLAKSLQKPHPDNPSWARRPQPSTALMGPPVFPSGGHQASSSSNGFTPQHFTHLPLWKGAHKKSSMATNVQPG